MRTSMRTQDIIAHNLFLLSESNGKRLYPTVSEIGNFITDNRRELNNDEDLLVVTEDLGRYKNHAIPIHATVYGFACSVSWALRGNDGD